MARALHLQFTSEGILFSLRAEAGTSAPPAFPLDPAAAADAPADVRALESLWLEDRLQVAEGGFLLPVGEIYALDPAEAAALGIPAEPEPLTVELRTNSYAGQPDFAVRAVTRDAAGTILPSHRRVGPFFLLADRVSLAPRALWELYRLLDEGPPADLTDQLRFVAEVRRRAEVAGAVPDRYLLAQEVVAPEGIGVIADFEAPDRVVLRPSFEGLSDEFPEAADSRTPTRAAYTRVDGTRRKRLVLDSEERRLSDEIKKRHVLSGADVPRFLDNPEAFLPEGIDLSRFSLRVRGLVPRRYSSQPYVRLQPSKDRRWFDFAAEISVAPVPPLSQGPGDGAPASGAAPPSPEGGSHEPVPGEKGPPQLPPDEYANLCREVLASGDRYVRHGDAWIEIDPEVAERFLEGWDAVESTPTGERRIPVERAYVLDVISNLDELEFQVGSDRQPPLPLLPDYPPPSALRARLLDHQLFGYRWLRFLHENGYGGLLADDMGLGKTVQVIALLAYLAETGALQPSLVVVPLALAGNWVREIRKFCPAIHRIYVHAGPGRYRDSRRIAQAEVVITTYETLRRDQLILGQVDWTAIICDEAQKVKNPTAQATSAVKGMKARLRVAATGTPVENGLSELWCIVDYVQPGKLGSQRDFRELFERPIRDSAEEIEIRLEVALRLQERLSPHYIRRTKEDVLELPPREDRSLHVGMGPRQLALYAGVIEAFNRETFIPLQALQYLLAICSHPEVFDLSGAPIERLIDECPKLSATLEILEDVRRRGEKAVIFTRLRRMQRILQDALAYRFGIHAAILNGEVAGDRRLDFVDDFNEAPGFRAMILSPEAAGVGLNITGANHVIHYTRLWNPAKENQATDRVHRIGQKRPVTVYYPVVEGVGAPSVEQRLDELLAEKRALARDVLWPRESLNVGVDEMAAVLRAPEPAG